MRLIAFVIWFFLPAGLANAAPVFASRLPGLRAWNAPLDFSKSFRGHRIFGANKTWRGLLFGTAIAGLFGTVQYLMFHDVLSPDFRLILLSGLTGTLMGFGALVGDAVESFLSARPTLGLVKVGSLMIRSTTS